ncbi:MAG: tRNA (adenosine(37)-N6)-dimethylallyltransferase MiaA [Patescibacteria group bacterium]
MARVRQPKSAVLPRIVCVVGPTSSGKTSLGIRLAKRHDGEVVNADSRQVYKDISIGTGKPDGVRGTYQGHRAFLVEGVPHYLMDFLDPADPFTVVEWRDKAVKAIDGIVKRKHLPLVVGGTGLYVSALVDNFMFPRVEPKLAMREAFQEKSLAELVALLVNLDPEAKQTVDLKNPRRVIRALEVVTFTGKPFSAQKIAGKPLYDFFEVGIRWSREELYERIGREIDEMVQRGWVEEIREALKKGIPANAPALTSIGYREFIGYVKGERTLEQAIAASKLAVRHYAKRQETWFRKDTRIKWAKDEDEAVEMVEMWLK